MQRTTRSQLHDREGVWEGRLWESHQPMNKNLIRGRQDGTSWHNTVKFPHSVLEVNEAVGWRRFQCLPSEICLARRPAKTGSVHRGNTVDIRQKSAEAIVVGLKRVGGRKIARLNNETRGATTQRRAEPMTMNRPDHPPVALELTSSGKHGYRNLAEKESSCEVTLETVELHSLSRRS